MLTENSTDPQVLRSLLHLLIGVPLLGGLHSLFQLHQTPADTWTAAYLTAREGTELM